MIYEQKDEHGWTRSSREENLQFAKNCLHLVNNFTITTNKKIEHTWKLSELKKLYDACTEVNKYIFDTEYCYEFNRYQNGIFFKEKKDKLDLYLYSCKKRLYDQLQEIYKMHDEALHGNITYQ